MSSSSTINLKLTYNLEDMISIESINCPSCRRVINVKDNCTKFSSTTTDHYDYYYYLSPPPSPPLLEEVFMVKCTSCDKCIGIIENEKFLTLDEILTDSTKQGQDGWKNIEEEENSRERRRRDRLILFTLSQIIYKEYEMPEESQLQVQFTFPPPTDLIKLLWINGRAVGFYCMKPKGTFDPETMECYSMITLDTIFIRIKYRRKGFASLALQDILTDSPKQNIGFSYPLSIPMKKVLAKNLKERPQDRPLFWEITGCGTANSGNCRNLWWILHKTQGASTSD